MKNSDRRNGMTSFVECLNKEEMGRWFIKDKRDSRECKK